jgi:hypothetical protein
VLGIILANKLGEFYLDLFCSVLPDGPQQGLQIALELLLYAFSLSQELVFFIKYFDDLLNLTRRDVVLPLQLLLHEIVNDL